MEKKKKAIGFPQSPAAVDATSDVHPRTAKRIAEGVLSAIKNDEYEPVAYDAATISLTV
jgi:hypothetical protein